ncbi:MAG TPA: hypothetical protein VH601_26030 [Bryobacteraceae bacterium]|jgi:hypothetical protein
MEQQFMRWIPLAVALAAAATILLRHMHVTKERRSFGQFLILGFYKWMRYLWAIVRAVDVAYLEYRRVLEDTPLQIENERHLGKLVKASLRGKPVAYGWQEQ